MPKIREKYLVAGVDLYHLRNRNEQRVAKFLDEHIARLDLDDLPPELIMDAYAYALNNLPARYTQLGTIVLRDPVRDSDIAEVVSSAFSRVLSNPR